jgi:hypothetical protein
MAMYSGRPIIPVDLVCKDHFSHLTVDQFCRKVASGDIALPLVRIETSQKAAKGVHINDLAAWIDARHADAIKECRQLQR